NNLMNAVARRPDIARPPFEHVVFLAPACTFDDFASVAARHAEMWETFRLFAMTDDAERADALVPAIYPRSLLYLVSGVLESNAAEPLVGLERCFAAPGAVPDYVLGRQGQAVWSPADGPPGCSSGALSHA